MFTGKLAYCRRHMTAFVNGELPDHARRRVARYIDSCQGCYDLYIQERQLQRELRSELSSLVRPQSAQLNRLWQTIQAEIQNGVPSRPAISHKRYGLATLTLVIVLMLPFALDGAQFSQSIATPPTPRDTIADTVSQEMTTRSPLQPTAVAVATLVPDPWETIDELARIVPEAVPPRTPEADEY